MKVIELINKIKKQKPKIIKEINRTVITQKQKNKIKIKENN